MSKNKRKKLIIIAVALVAVIGIAATVYAASYDPSSDPLVALSYITDVLRPSINSDIKAASDKISAAERRIAEIENTIGKGLDFDTTEIDGRLSAAESNVSDILDSLDDIKGDINNAKAELWSLEKNKASKDELKAVTEKLDGICERLDGVDSLYKSLLDELISEREQGAENNYGFETVTLSKGKTVSLPHGGDIMLRGGSGRVTFFGMAYDNTGKSDIKNGASAVNGHILSFYGNVTFTADADNTTVMIRGDK